MNGQSINIKIFKYFFLKNIRADSGKPPVGEVDKAENFVEAPFESIFLCYSSLRFVLQSEENDRLRKWSECEGPPATAEGSEKWGNGSQLEDYLKRH